MCNAWNHPQHCTCGWGGGYSGGSTYSNSAPVPSNGRLGSLENTYDSYVNPNASCPVCGASVFFYQCFNGGRVFFDELGPPWPKHPCTDNASRPGRISPASSNTNQQTTYAWQQDGWQPFIIESVIRYSSNKDYFRVTGALRGQRLSLDLVDEHHQLHQAPSKSSPAQIKNGLTVKSFRLSILLPKGSPLTFDAFSV